MLFRKENVSYLVPGNSTGGKSIQKLEAGQTCQTFRMARHDMYEALS
jgi:hypothetical protein